MQLQSVKDSETGAYTLAYFSDLAGREIDRARRYGRRFALVTLQPEGLGHQDPVAEAETIEGLAVALSGAVRESDVVARVDHSEFYVLLPETGLLGAIACRNRVIEQLASTAPASKPRTGVSVYPNDGEDLGRLIRTSRRRAARKLDPWLRSWPAEDPPFWELVDHLLATSVSGGAASANEPNAVGPYGALPQDEADEGAATRQFSLGGIPKEAVSQLARMVVSDAAAHRLHGTLYMFGNDPATAEVAREMRQAGSDVLQAWCLEHRAVASSPSHLPLSDPRLASHMGLLALTDSSAFALLGRSIGDNEVQAFQSSDLTLVNILVRAMQRTYHLQPGLRG